MVNSLLREGLGEESFFFRAHPIVNLCYFAGVIGVTMFSNHPAFLLLSFLAAFGYSLLLGGLKSLKTNLLLLLPTVLIMTLFNVLSVHNGVTVLFYVNGNRVTREALLFGLASGVLLASVLIWFRCFSVIVTGEKLIYLFGRPAPMLALTLSMILRYIPLLLERFKQIDAAQRCMGRSFRRGGLIKRFRQFGKELSILISWSLEASIESADSMEARGYGLRRRTSFHLYRFTKSEGLLLLALFIPAALAVLVCALGKTSIWYYPAVVVKAPDALQITGFAAFGLLALLPPALDLWEVKRWS